MFLTDRLVRSRDAQHFLNDRVQWSALWSLNILKIDSQKNNITNIRRKTVVGEVKTIRAQLKQAMSDFDQFGLDSTILYIQHYRSITVAFTFL